MKMQKDYVEWCIMQTNNKKQIHNIAYMFQNIIKKSTFLMKVQHKLTIRNNKYALKLRQDVNVNTNNSRRNLDLRQNGWACPHVRRRLVFRKKTEVDSSTRKLRHSTVKAQTRSSYNHQGDAEDRVPTHRPIWLAEEPIGRYRSRNGAWSHRSHTEVIRQQLQLVQFSEAWKRK